MKFSEVKEIAELIGIAAIVASLIFVGIQMRQTHEIAIANQYHSRAEATLDMFLALQESGTSVNLLSKPADEMTPQEQRSARNMVAWSWTQFDNHHFQYQSGFINDEAWAALSRRIEWLHAMCDHRNSWESLRQFLRQSFVEYVESLDDNCSSPD